MKVQRELGVPHEIRRVEAHIGDVYMAQGRLTQAMAIFQRLNEPIRLGRYYLQAGEYERAWEQFARSLRGCSKSRP